MQHLQSVSEVVGELADRVSREESQHQLWRVDGAATAGKSTVLHELARSLNSRFVPVVVSPAPGELDAGPAALLQVAAQLKARHLINGESSVLFSTDTALSDKIDTVRKWLDDHRSQVVLLCDEPTLWPATGREDQHFGRRAWGVVTSLLEAPCRRVVAGHVPEGTKVDHVRDLALESSPRDWLREKANWGTLADAAGALAQRPTDELSRYSPLQLRFLVALRAMDIAPLSGFGSPVSRRALSRLVANSLESDAELTALRAVWTKLALIRRPFDEELLAKAGANSLSTRARDLLLHCLLYRRENEFVLHETLRADALARDWLDRDALGRAHADFARIYAERFRVDSGRFLDELEAYHHATQASDAQLLSKLSPMFVEQLDAAGRAHSLAARRERDPSRRAAFYEVAVTSFRSSVKWEPLNAYAHHYLAFNLDVQGRNTKDVEFHYPQAIELEPRTPWWHSRWICYLITRGQMSRAESAWDDALDALGLPARDAAPFVYEGLHVWVARLLLHRGHLDFAERVLKGVSPEQLQNTPGLRALLRRLNVLLEVRQRRALMPSWLMRPDWWKDRPALLQLQDRGKLVRWIAARVDEVDLQEKVLRFDGAETTVGQTGEPTGRALEVPFAEFDAWNPDEPARSLAAGRFVEIGIYVAGKRELTQTRARVHQRREWQDDELPPLFPDPTRWMSSWATARADA